MPRNRSLAFNTPFFLFHKPHQLYLTYFFPIHRIAPPSAADAGQKILSFLVSQVVLFHHSTNNIRSKISKSDMHQARDNVDWQLLLYAGDSSIITFCRGYWQQQPQQQWWQQQIHPIVLRTRSIHHMTLLLFGIKRAEWKSLKKSPWILKNAR